MVPQWDSHPISASPKEENSEEDDQSANAEEQDEEAALEIGGSLFLELQPFLLQEIKEGLQQLGLVHQKICFFVFHEVFYTEIIRPTNFIFTPHTFGCSCSIRVHGEEDEVELRWKGLNLRLFCLRSSFSTWAILPVERMGDTKR